ncbi:carcinoembryonic antigen-related cell adhesion molecule 5-like [Clarias gariepinus]|uniref:carcinoembryonic antigen-related cell adhesion molecule 5-like n=1 Tax=Clarias gariepinus TaxID=13013 RepID=UPI00234C2D76|nr:carcinoembryonic antigen-related cell adhesion molecule 5-like [Clarias gariepinus]
MPDEEVIAPTIVTEGQSAIVICNTTCSLTDPTFIWYKNSHNLIAKTIKSNEVHLQPVSSEDAGSYSCAVKGYEHLPSPAHTLRVRYAPKNVSVSIGPSGDVEEDSPVTLTCSSNANPPVENYTWFKVNEFSAVGFGQSYRALQSGQYYCEAQNKHGSERSAAVTISVTYPPKNVAVSITPSGVIVENSLVTLTCSSNANPPVIDYEWYKGTTLVGKGKTYTISKFISKHRGAYKCKCSNEVGHQDSSSVILNVLYPPKNVAVSVSPSHEIEEGSSVTLTCSSDANPPVKYYEWYKRTTLVEKGKTITISNFSSEDNGKYKCKCGNEVRHQYSHGVTLNILYPPKNVSVSISSSGQILEDSLVTLTCSSDANPPVENYTWFKVNESSAVGSGQSYRAPQSGQYYCEAQNKHGSERSAAVTMHVVYPPKIVLVYISPSGEIVEGSSVTLTCSSDANPPVEIYTWFKGRKSVGNEETYTISDISSEDSGEYKCKCSNEVGHQESSSVTLNVLYPPKNVSVAMHPAGEDNLVTLKCSSDANPPAEIYTWFNVKESSAVGSGPSYKVLQSGQYYCEAQNKHGFKRSEVLNKNHLYPPKNVSVTISSSGEIVEGSSVTLTCSSDANPPVENYTWFKVNESSAVGSGQSYRALQSGQYYCEAQNKHGSERSAALTVLVIYPPKNVSVSISPSGEIVEDSSVTLTCSSDANPPVENYTWFKVNESSAVGSGQSYSFNFNSSSKDQYYCEAQNKHGSERSAAVSVTLKDLQVIAPAEVTEGQSAVLTCKTTCSLTDPTFIWYKTSRDLTTNTIKSNEVHLQNVSSEDAGSYSCAVRGYEHLPSPAHTLRVRYHPKNVSVSISPSGEIVEGSSVTLTCSSDVNPPVENYTWFKGTTSVRKGKTYTISNISSEDSGEYKCKCNPPKNVSVSISPSGEIVEGRSVTLTCSSDANPPVEIYTWFKGTTSVGKVKTYTMSNISSKDSGEYKCKCINKHGHQYSNSVTLTVLYPPKNVSVSTSSSGEIVEGSSVTLTCSSDANPPVEIYTWFKVNESSAVGSGQSYRALQSGQYYCEAQNKHGSERSAAVSVTLKEFQSTVVGIAVGVIVFVFVFLIVAFLFIRKHKRNGSTINQSLQWDNFSSSVALASPNITVSESASTNQNEVLYTNIVHQSAVSPRNTESSSVKSTASKDKEIQYSSIKFTRTGADNRPDNDEEPSVFYSSVK